MTPDLQKNLLNSGYFIAIAFTKSRSPYFKMAVEIAKNASFYEYDDQKNIHLAAYKIDRMDAALELLRITFDWKGSFVNTGQSITTTRKASFTVECLVRGKDVKDYCNDAQEFKKEQIEIPCKQIYPLSQYEAKDLKATYERALADSDCKWCPRFDSNFEIKNRVTGKRKPHFFW